VALRIVFCGTPAFAVPSLQRLFAERDFEVLGAVTQPDRPRGRGREIQSPAVKDAALAAGIPVYQPEKIKSAYAEEYFRRLAPDAVVIIAYGQIISQRLIDMPRLGWINLHASLLPKYRGAAPINWAIVTGPVLLKYETEIGADETAPELTARLAEAGAPLVVETLRNLDRGEITPTPQDHAAASPAPPLKKEDGRIDWSQAAPQIYARIRGLQPWPGAFTTFRGKNAHIWGKPAPPDETPKPGTIVVRASGVFVVCGGDSAIELESVQIEGRKRVSAREFANGARLTPGERFGG